MIPLPEAEAAYNRLTHLQAQPGDIALVMQAIEQPGMPVVIVEFGNAMKASSTAATNYQFDPSIVNLDAWSTAIANLRSLVVWNGG